MRTLFIEMPSGVAGDMLLAGLLHLEDRSRDLAAALTRLGLPPDALERSLVSCAGIQACRVDCRVPQEPTWDPHGHDHRGLKEVLHTVEAAGLSQRCLERACRVFRLLAEAEAAVHGVTPEAVHFHEVGALDAIADVVGVCLMLEWLGVERVAAGPFTLGSGWVACRHGRMPVPVPAVVELIRRAQAPHRRLEQETGELTTPTGAALVCGLADTFAPVSGTLLAVGYGAGHRQIPGLVNLLRLNLYEEEASGHDRVIEIRSALDDCTGEHLGLVLAQALERGALDAYALPALMKKGRPGHELVLLAEAAAAADLADWLLTASSAIGLRLRDCERRLLPREEQTLMVEGRAIRFKVVRLPSGAARAKPEAEDLAAWSTAADLPFVEVQRRALVVWERDRSQA